MSNKMKTIISVASFLVFVLSVYYLFFVIPEISFARERVLRHTRPEWKPEELYYEENMEMLRYYTSRLLKQRVGLAALLLSNAINIVLNLLMWLNKTLFGVPLTPEQAAERKRIIAEKKRAKLQEKLEKLN